MKQKVTVPDIYVDTNIIRDFSDRRDTQSIHLLEIIRKKKWKCSSAVFTMMELCDVEKDYLFFQNTYVKQRWSVNRFLRERYRKSLSEVDFRNVKEYVDSVKETLSFITFFNLDQNGWNTALNLSMNTNLRASDCIQLATAVVSQCNSFITRDEHLESVITQLAKESDIGEVLTVFCPKDFLKAFEQ